MTERFTKGPWTVEEPMDNTLSIVQAGKEAHEWWFIANCSMPDEEDHLFTGSEVIANAKLIAAAPDLLAALRGVLAVADRKTVEFDAARAAIAKATA